MSRGGKTWTTIGRMHVSAGPEPGDVSIGYRRRMAMYSMPTDADFDAFHAKVRGAVPELSVGYVRKRAPKPPRRGKTRRSRQVRSKRARAKRRVEQRMSRAEVVEFEVLGHKLTARRDRQRAVESIVRDRIERATPRGA